MTDRPIDQYPKDWKDWEAYRSTFYGFTPMKRSGAPQDWLQNRPWPLWRIGNGLSSLHYWCWRLFTREGRGAY